MPDNIHAQEEREIRDTIMNDETVPADKKEFAIAMAIDRHHRAHEGMTQAAAMMAETKG